MLKVKHELLSFIYCKTKRIKLIVFAVIIAGLFCLQVCTPQPAEAEGLSQKDSAFNSVTISWHAAKGAKEYYVYRDDGNGVFTHVKTTSDTKFTDKGLKTDHTYKYRVSSGNYIRNADPSRPCTAKPKLDSPVISAKADGAFVNVTAGSVLGARTYDIYRNGKKIAAEPAGPTGMQYRDKTVKAGKEYSYEVTAVRGSSQSDKSAPASVKMISAGKIKAEILGEKLTFSWKGNKAYSKYRLYKGKDLLAETEDTFFETDAAEGTYDMKLTGIADGKEGPASANTFKVGQGKLSADQVIEAAIEWGESIGEDNSFHYGRKSKGAQNLGCYFCGTNKPGKCKKRMPAKEMEKTWACCEFVTACFVHGAGVQDMDCMKHWIGTRANSNKYLKGSDNWDNKGHLSYSSLKRGDVLMTKGHTVIYLGNGKCLESHGGDNGKYGSHSWNWSIGVHDYAGRYSKSKTITWRYTGDGSGAQGLSVTEVGADGSEIEPKE